VLGLLQSTSPLADLVQGGGHFNSGGNLRFLGYGETYHLAIFRSNPLILLTFR